MSDGLIARQRSDDVDFRRVDELSQSLFCRALILLSYPVYPCFSYFPFISIVLFSFLLQWLLVLYASLSR